MSRKLFDDFVEKNNLEIEVVELDESTHTAEDAAKANGVSVSNIVKSLLIKVSGEDKNIFKLILVPGDKRLNFEEWKVKFDTNEIQMATPDEVKIITGHSIGGVPPFGHLQQLETFLADGFDKTVPVVAAAGSASSVFRIDYEKLKEIIMM